MLVPNSHGKPPELPSSVPEGGGPPRLGLSRDPSGRCRGSRTKFCSRNGERGGHGVPRSTVVSRTNLLGLVISIFGHWDMTRLQQNAQTLLFLAVIFPFTNFSQDSKERVRRSSW